MGFDRDRLPSPADYYSDREGLKLTGPRSSPWRTTECRFHGGSDSMRINLRSGAWKCMNCGEGGGDVLAYEMKVHSLDFIEAAKRLGCWIEDGKTPVQQKPTALAPRSALQLLHLETNLVAIAAGNVAHGIELTPADRARLMTAARRIAQIAQDFQP